MLVYPHEILQNHFPQRRGSECAEYVVRLSQATSPRSGLVQQVCEPEQSGGLCDNALPASGPCLYTHEQNSRP